MNRIAFGGSPEPEFIIAFTLGGLGNAILESVRLLPMRRFDRDSKVWKAPWSAASQVKALAERYAFDVTPEAKVVLDAAIKLAPTVVSIPRRLTKTARGLEFIFNYDEALIAEIKTLPGRLFDGDKKIWWLPFDVAQGIADPVGEIAKRNGFNVDIAAQQYLDEARTARSVRVVESRALDAGPIDRLWVATDGGINLNDRLRPFQRAGVHYALKTKRLIIGDPVGLGKTVQALATIEAANAYPVLFVCKPVSRWQMRDEVVKWLPHRSVQVLSGETPVEIVRTDFVIVPWSVLDAWKDELSKITWGAVIPDELHYAKERKSKRTKAIKSLVKGVEYRIGLTATDIKSRPSELISQLEILDRLDDLGGWYVYATRYCGGFKDQWGNWNLRGDGNIDELHERLRATCYLRREKKDVLPELPDVQYTPVPLDVGAREMAKYRRAETDLITWLGERAAAKAAAKGLPDWAQRSIQQSAEAKAERFEQLMRIGALKEAAAMGKLKSIIEWLNGFLDASETEKIIVFTEHRAMTEALAKEFKAPAIYGGVSDKQREAAKEAFQDVPGVRVLIANMQSAGESLTLTAANHIAFAEFPWTPADVDQAIGRAYGRLNDVHGVTAWYLIARGTIEEEVVRLLGAKRAVTSKVVSGIAADVDEGGMIDALTKSLATRAA
jgi:SNF2 family DNA or RNA helicase